MNPTLSPNDTTTQDRIASLNAQSDTLHKNHHFGKHPAISISPPLAPLLHSGPQLHNDKQHLKKDASLNHKNLSPKYNSSSSQQSQHKNSKSANQTVKKKRKCEEVIVDGFAICAFKSWEDLQDELNEEIAANKANASSNTTTTTTTGTATKYDAVFPTAQKSASNQKNGSSKSSSKHKHSSSTSTTSQTHPEETIAQSDNSSAGSANKKEDTAKSNKSSSYSMQHSQQNLRSPLHVNLQTETKFSSQFQPQQHSTIRHQSFQSPWNIGSTTPQVPAPQQPMNSSQCRPCSVSPPPQPPPPPPVNQVNQMPYQPPNPAINPHLFPNHAIQNMHQQQHNMHQQQQNMHQQQQNIQQSSNLNPHPALQHPPQLPPFSAYPPQMQSSSTMTSMSMSALGSPYSCPPPFIITDTTISRQTSIIPPLPSALDQAAAASRYNHHANMLQSMNSYNQAAVAAAAAAAAAATSSHPHPQMYYPPLTNERSFMDFTRSYTGQSNHLSGYPMNPISTPAPSIADSPYGFDRWPRMALDHRRAVNRYSSLFPSTQPNFTSYSNTSARPSSFPTGLFQTPFYQTRYS